MCLQDRRICESRVRADGGAASGGDGRQVRARERAIRRALVASFPASASPFVPLFGGRPLLPFPFFLPLRSIACLLPPLPLHPITTHQHPSSTLRASTPGSGPEPEATGDERTSQRALRHACAYFCMILPCVHSSTLARKALAWARACIRRYISSENHCRLKCSFSRSWVSKYWYHTLLLQLPRLPRARLLSR